MKVARWFGIVVAAGIGIIATAVALAPTFLSTSWGLKTCLNVVSRWYSGSVEIESLSVGWFTGADIRGLSIKDSQGRNLIECSQFSLDKPLIALLVSQKDFGTIQLVSPTVYCYGSQETYSVPKESLHRGSGAGGKKERQARSEKTKTASTEKQRLIATPDLKGTISITKAQVVAVENGATIGKLFDGEASLQIDLLRTSSGSLTASLSQNASNSTPISVTFSTEGAPNLIETKGSVSFSCQRIPTGLVAAFARSLHPDIAEFLHESFGSSISYSLSASANGPHVVVHSLLSSENIQSSLQVTLENERLTVAKGELFSGTVSPRLFNLLIDQALPDRTIPITLLAPSSIACSNNSPLSVQLSDFTLLSPCDLQWSTTKPLLLSTESDAPPLSISLTTLLQGTADAPSASIDLTASSGMNNGSVRGSVSGAKKDSGFLVSSTFNSTGQWPQIAESVTRFPSTALFGPTLTATVQTEGLFHSLDDFSFRGKADLSSQNIHETGSFSITDSEFSMSQTSTDAKIPVSVVERYFKQGKFVQSSETVTIQSTVNSFTLPLNHFIPQLSAATIDAQVKAQAPKIMLNAIEGVSGSLESADLTISKAEHSPAAQFSLQLSVPVTSKKQPLITSLIGTSGLQLSLKGTYDLAESIVGVQSADLSGSRVSAAVRDASCRFGKGIDISLQSPAKIRAIVDKDTLCALFSQSPSTNFAGPAELSATIKPFSLLLTDGSWQGTKLMAELESSDIRFTGKQSLGPYRMSLPFSYDLKDHLMRAEPAITSNGIRLFDSSATISLPTSTEESLTENATIACSAELRQFPTAIIDLFSEKALSPIIGDALSSKLTLDFHGLSAKGNRFSLTASGFSWKLNMNLALDALHLSAAASPAIDLEASLSPKSFRALQSLIGKKSDVSIGNDVTVRCVVPKCCADLTPLFSDVTSHQTMWKLLDSLSLSANTTVSALTIHKNDTSIGQLAPIEGAFAVSGRDRSVTYDISSSDGREGSVSIDLKGSLKNIWDENGLALPSSHLRSTVGIDRFPTQLLDLAFPQQGAVLEEAIGKTIRLTGELSANEMKSGSVRLDLLSKNCSLHLDGAIQNSLLTLKTPATASFSIANETGAMLLKNVNPLLATAVHSEKPLQLSIDPAGAQIPLSPFSLTTIILPKVTADIGKISVKNGGALKIILALLNMGQAANGKNLDLWFTPIYMNVNRGVITCQRADALVADKIHMITWGDIDLNKDRINMVIAIPQESLSALRLQMISPTPERGLQIPITGAASNPKIDTTRATARLAGAALVDNVPDPRLQMFGGILQAAAATVGEPDKPVPPPTTQPFPWEREKRGR